MAAAPYTPPYSYGFASGLGEFSTNNANSDNKTFYYTSYSGYAGEGGVAYDGAGADTADDWLFSPELSLQEGLVYEISFLYKSSSYNKTNKFEVKAGTTATVDGMTMTISEPQVCTQSYDFSTKTVRLTPPSTGNYVVGIHLISDGDQGYFYIDEFSVASGKNSAQPDAPTAGTVSYSVNGDKLNASFDITAPANNFAGHPLSGNLTLNILRADRETPETLTATPGQTVTYTDTDALTTNTTYTVSCTSAGLEGESITVNANPVLGTPKPVENFTAAQDGNVFTLTWDAVTEPTVSTDLFVPAKVTYNVKCGNVTVAENLANTSCSYTYPMPESGQEIVNFSIEAKHSNNLSATVKAGPYIVGDPIAGAFAESFANYSYSNGGWSTDEASSYYGWKPSVGASGYGIEPQDADNGVLTFSHSFGSTQRLYSPKLDLSTLNNAKLKFWVYMRPSNDNATTFQPGFVTNGVETLFGEPMTVMGADNDGWQEFTYVVPESALSGTTQLVFIGTGKGTFNNIYLDNITIRSYLDHNLAVEAVAPANSLKIGQEVIFTANVSNFGANTESDYTVSLYAGEDLVTTIEGTEIPVDGMVSVALPFKALPKYAGQDVEFRMEVALASDLEDSNNEATVTIPVLTNELVIPTDLTATSTVENVQLAWAAPAVSTEPVVEEITESFEEWTSGTIEPEAGWVFINADDNAMKGVNGLHAGEQYAAMVSEAFSGTYNWDPSLSILDGQKALIITLANSSYVTLNKWIISPEVKGGTDVSFFAQTFYPYSASNTFDILWSTGGTAAEDFTVLESKTVSQGNWVECTFTLPTEARRFAIHFNSRMDGNLLAFDKFTFTSYSAPAVLSGYNLYRDDAFVATLPADVTSYADAEALPDVTHTYNVTALYDKGESLYSEAATGSRGTSVGIQGIDSDLEDAQYYTLDGLRIDNPAKGQIVIVRRGDKVSKMIIK